MAIENLITEHIDIWTSAIQSKSSSGRGSSKKMDLYGIKKLRELILELAVRGKLVPQDPNDEPASVLLERIATEKEQLIKAKKIRRTKTANSSDMPIVNFSKPSGWGLAWLEELVVNSSDNIVDGPFGSKLKATEYVDSGIPIIRIQNVDRNRFKSNGLQFITPEKAVELERHSFVSGDIVLNKLGEPTGKACIIPESLKQGIIVADIVRIRLDAVIVDKQFLIFAINSPFVANQFSNLAKGVTRQRVNLSQIRSLSLPIPPAKEQIKIVDRVNKLMTLCDQLEQQTEASIEAHQVLVETLLATLTNSADADELMENWQRISTHFDTLFTTEASIDQLKQTILQLAVMGKLVPQDPNDEPASILLERIEEEKAQLVKDGKIKRQKALPPIAEDEKPFELPEGWCFSRLENLSELITKGSSPKWQGVSYTENPEDILFVTSENVGAFNLLLDSKKYVEKKFNDIEPRSILKKYDFLMNIVGASIGRTALYDIDDMANINQAVCLIRSFPQQVITGFFLLFFNSRTCVSYMYDKQVENARPNLSMGNIAKFVIPVPPLEEQKRIIAKIAEFMEVCEQLQTCIKDAQTTQLHLTDSIVEQVV
jgi:type I restriction enzyme S subunit